MSKAQFQQMKSTKLCISDHRMESDLTRELQPCSANTDLIPDHKPIQLGMYSSKCRKQRGILEKNIIIKRFSFLCHS